MSRKILLLEPNYNNKYPPMGLMKIATYYRNRGDDVRFYKGDLKQFAAKLLFEEFYSNFLVNQNVVNDEAPSEAELQSIKNDIAKYESLIRVDIKKLCQRRRQDFRYTCRQRFKFNRLS